MKRLLFLFILSVSARTSFACDACGCSLGGNYFGILPQFNKNFVGVRYAQSHFRAHMHHAGSSLPDEFSSDTYNRIELWSRIYISKRVQLLGFLPYHINQMRGTEQNADVQGVGDVSIMVHVLLFNTGEDWATKYKQTLRVGGGLKLPTGKFNQLDAGALLNPNFQRGTGSVDFTASLIYTARYNQIGFNVESGYKYNMRNRDHYRFGNQFNTQGQVFYWYNMKKLGVTMLPNAGLYMEQAAQHRAYLVKKVNTGGSALFFSYGAEVYVKAFALGINVKHPFVQQLHSDEGVKLTMSDRFSAHVTWSF